jgi:PncC family amidohydrolase
MNFDNPQQELVYLLSEKNKTLAIAESCTGGLISKMITDIEGSSNVFLGSIIAYSNVRGSCIKDGRVCGSNF